MMERSNPCAGDELQHSLREAAPRAVLRFEVLSWIGRHFLSRYPPLLRNGDRLLNLGCGSKSLEGWVNADFFRLRSWRQPHSFWGVDLRYPLKCHSSYWDGVYSEHVIEHLAPSQAFALFQEVFRTLKGGGWFRVSTPDLRRYVRYYLGETPDEQFQRWPYRAAALRSLSQGWGHRSLWDAELLVESLKRAGFVAIREVSHREGSDSRLLMDLPERRWESVYVEAQKPHSFEQH